MSLLKIIKTWNAKWAEPQYIVRYLLLGINCTNEKWQIKAANKPIELWVYTFEKRQKKRLRIFIFLPFAV